MLALIAAATDAYAGMDAPEAEIPIIAIKASRFAYSPNQISVKKGQTVILEIESTDRLHGFAIPELGIRADALPGEKKTIKITPANSGRFVFYCDIFCGSGHEQMAGEIIVEN